MAIERPAGRWREPPAWRDNPYLPGLARITGIEAAGDAQRLLTLRFLDADAARRFRHRPGQFVMLGLPGIGEAPFSIASSPTRPETFEVSVRRVGRLTAALHRLAAGDVVGARGPYGNGFPLPELEGSDLLLVAAGPRIGALRSLLRYALDRRDRFGRLILVYGAATPEAMAFRDELLSLPEGVECLLAVEADPGGGWPHALGDVPTLLERVRLDPMATQAALCGPAALYRDALPRLVALGLSKDRILLSLERRMRCGVGTCGHCAIGYVRTCLHGPIFTYWDALNVPELVG